MQDRDWSRDRMLLAHKPSTDEFTFRAILGLLIVATVLTRIHSMDKSLWGDEAWVANAILEPTINETIYYRSWLQTCPPLFLVLNRFIIRVLGVSNETFRLVPVLFGIASIIPMIYVASRLLRPFFLLVAIFLFVFCPELVPYTHELKQYSTDVFVSLMLVSLGLMYLNRQSKAVLYFWLAIFAILSFLSYQALIFIPGMLFVTLVSLRRGDSRQDVLWDRWIDALAVALSGLVVSIVNYFVFIKPNKQPLLDMFWRSEFFHGEGVWDLLVFYATRFLHLASLLFLTQLYSSQRVLQIFICSILIVGVSTLYVRGLMRDKEKLEQAIFLSMPIICVNFLNIVGLYPLGTTRLMLFLTPIVIVLFVYGLQSVSYGVSRVLPTVSQANKVQDALGALSLIVLVPLLCLYINLKGTSPLFRSEPEEDSERGVRYLSQTVQPDDVVYIHASMREQFKLYSRLMPLLSTNIVWGNIGWPCCPRDISVDRLGESDDILSAEMARLEIAGKSNSVWLVFSDRPGYWRRSGRRGPGIFEPWLKAAGCLPAELVPLRGVRIDKYQCNGTEAKQIQSLLGNQVRQLGFQL
jgi:Dolichyl-phosphate-mannose-protein mannosyltransferase